METSGFFFVHKYTVLMSLDQHRISKGKEPIPLLHRLFIGSQHMLPSRKGGNQHDQSGFRQMEVGDQGVQHLEAVARIDENIRVAAARFHLAVLIGALSTVRQLVVPTQITLPPFFFVRLIFSAASVLT